MLDATLAGARISRLPAIVAQDYLIQGRIVEVMPGWHLNAGITHLVFPTRRGLIPSVRILIDHLASDFASAIVHIENKAELLYKYRNPFYFCDFHKLR